MEKYTKEYIIDYQYLNPDLSVTFPRLLSYALETSLRHTLHVGYHMEYFIQHQQGWAITHWDVIFHKFPKWDEKITVQTWVTSLKGFICERSFNLYGADGSTVMTANTIWVFTDLTLRAPIRPSKEMMTRYGEPLPHVHTRDFRMPSITADIENGNFELMSTRNLTVTRRDIDTNNHVNNVKYLEWVLDDLPDSLVLHSHIKSLKTVYKKECRYNENVIIELYRSTANTKYFVARIKSANYADGVQTQRIPAPVILSEVFMEWI